MINETIEEKTYRLMLAAALVTDPGISFEEAIEHEEFKLNCRLVELAIAEEREANAVECDNLHQAWRWDNEADSESGPRQCAKAIRQRSAPKAEVNQ